MSSNDGNDFRDCLAAYIESWSNELEIKKEKHIGLRFVGTPRKLDIIIRNKSNGKVVGIEAKLQRSQGTAYEKLSYALEDCKASPIPTLLVFAGNQIRMDMRSKLIMSGIGIEVGFKLDNNGKICEIVDPANLLKQRIYMELGLNWFSFLCADSINDKSYGDAYPR